jgi:hypothetical protein
MWTKDITARLAVAMLRRRHSLRRMKAGTDDDGIITEHGCDTHLVEKEPK